MGKKAEERAEETKKEHKDDKKYPKRKPRGALFHSGDPTLAQRIEEELYDFGR